MVGDEIFSCPVAFHDGAHHILRHVFVVGEQLFGIFRKAVSAIAEARVVVMVADARVEAYAFYDLLCVESFEFGISVEFVEVTHAERKVSVSEELHRFCLGAAHKQNRHIVFERSLLDELCKLMCRFFKTFVVLLVADDDTAWI